VTDLRKTVGKFTVATRVEQLGIAMRAMAPARKWRWLQRAADQIRAGAIASREAARPLSPDNPWGGGKPSARSNRCVPLAEWPALDRAAWDAALRPGDVLDTGGIVARWAPSTRSTVICAATNRMDVVLPHSGMLPGAHRLPHRDVPVASSSAAEGHT